MHIEFKCKNLKGIEHFVCVCVCVFGCVHALLRVSDLYAPATRHGGAWERAGVAVLCIPYLRSELIRVG
jgi:hypothetical protein